MTFSRYIKRAEKLVTDNSPLILTAIGVAGTVTTAVLTGQASYKASRIINELGDDEYLKTISLRDKMLMVWKLYIPAVSTGVFTCGCIVAANRIGTRRAAALAAAYSVLDHATAEYKDKVIEKFGENKERALRDEIAQDRVNRSADKNNIVLVGEGNVLCHDATTNQYFESSMEKLRRAENDINFQILHHDSASVSDFYSLIGLEPTSMSDDLGWNNTKRLELNFSSVLSPDGRPCLSFEFASVPFREPWRYV